MDTTRPSLLIRIRNQSDQSAWNEFDTIYRPMLRRFAAARGMNASDAEELAQDCMGLVNRYIAGFEYDPSKGRFKAWLRTMVSNRIKNRIRDRREVQADSGDMRRLPDDGRSPEDVFDKVWRQEHLKHCLRLIKNEVDPTTFDVFLAYAIEERPVDQICSQFEMSPNQVHAIKSRMTRRLRSRLTDILGEEA